MAVFQINAGQYLEFTTGGPGDAANPVSFKPREKSLSDHLIHVGMGVADTNRAIDFYAT
jgi:hypothetical protein